LLTVAVSVALISLLCLPVAADASRALHYSREHRRQHHRARENKKNNHVSLPPDVDGDSPPEAPGLPPEAGGAPPLPPPAEDDDCGDVFDVRAFGASGGDGGSCSDDTPAFRAAWKAACSSDSATATLLVPSDGVFTISSTIFSGPCKPQLTFQISFELHCLLPPRKIIDPSKPARPSFHAAVTVHQIDGVLMPPDGPASWPATDSRKQWVVFYKADRLTLAGEGTIEGNGEEWWDLPCKPHRVLLLFSSAVH
jgi:hypothetical protein